MSKTDIVISTSRKPSQRTRSFCKELQILLPRANYVQRGKSNFEELLQRSEAAGAHLLLLIGEREGNPGSLDLYSMMNPVQPVLSFDIEGLRLAREYGSEVRSHSRAIAFLSDSKANSVGLQRRLEEYFKVERVSMNEARILFIAGVESGRFRLTFMDSGNSREVGPSMTGRLRA